MKTNLLLAFYLLCGCTIATPPISTKISRETTNTARHDLEGKHSLNEPPLLIEINSVPPPFDVDGYMPYVLWINGMYIKNPDKKALTAIVSKIGVKNIPPIDPTNIHKGWLEPRFVKEYLSNPNSVTWEQLQKR